LFSRKQKKQRNQLRLHHRIILDQNLNINRPPLTQRSTFAQSRTDQEKMDDAIHNDMLVR
jgi:hypothetical protein